MKSKISVTRALAELKRLDDRINKAILDGAFVGVLVGKGSHERVEGASTSKDKVVGEIKSSFDSVTALIKKRSDIKSAIILSNAKTTVELAGKVMTVAEAIELKSSVVLKNTLCKALKDQLRASLVAIDQKNMRLEAVIEKHLETIYGSEKNKADSVSLDAVAKPQRDQKEASLLDPLSIQQKIKALEDEISLIDTELDFTLSEVNARTEIEVESV